MFSFLSSLHVYLTYGVELTYLRHIATLSLIFYIIEGVVVARAAHLHIVQSNMKGARAQLTRNAFILSWSQHWDLYLHRSLSY